MTTQIGTIHDKNTLFMRTECGEATDNTGGNYELSTNFGGGLPIVRNSKTGKWFTLNWQDIIGLAKAAGIDTP